VSRQVASGVQVELCLLCLPPGFPAVPHHFNLSPVGSCPSQNRACAINAHGSPDNHSGFDRTSRCGAVLWPPLLCAAGVSLLCSTMCRLLLSSGITRLRWYYETIRLPVADLPSSLWAVVRHTLGLSPPYCVELFLRKKNRRALSYHCRTIEKFGSLHISELRFTRDALCLCFHIERIVHRRVLFSCRARKSIQLGAIQTALFIAI